MLHNNQIFDLDTEVVGHFVKVMVIAAAGATQESVSKRRSLVQG